MENTPLYNKIMRKVEDMIEHGGTGDHVTITPALQTGTKVADFTVNDVPGVLYAPSTAGLATESYVDSAVADLASETYVDTAVAQKSKVTLTTNLSSGTKIATCVIDGTNKDLYAPSTAGLASTTYVDNQVATVAGIANSKIAASDLKLASKIVSVTLSNNGTAWGSIDVDPGQTLIAASGYYLKETGNSSTMTYAFYAEPSTGKVWIGLRTWLSTTHTVKAELQYLYV